MKLIITFLFAITGLFFFAGSIDLDNLPNYANQEVPNYINRNNTPRNNEITNQGATLGRVLFYDKNLSANNTIACADCHKQEFAFGDPATVSQGLNGGATGRHSMRLVNARFAEEVRFFWDKRSASLEDQTTQPIQDHIEMGFSGADGDPSFADLIEKMSEIDYYQQLFTEVYGDEQITEDRMQLALAQFIRSIQSFDSKYDDGRVQVNDDNADFPNFTAQENQGKRLFSRSVNQGGANCQDCHRAPTFDIAPNRRNNGVIGVAGDPTAVDLNNTRSPSLRDLVNPNGQVNGPMMHDGSLPTLLDVINHYDRIEVAPNNNNLDNRLRGGRGGQGQNLQLTNTEKDALVAFLGTLTGSAIYTDERWSNPFDASGNLTILNGSIANNDQDNDGFDITVDCDDNNANIHPNAIEIPDNNVDENCDGIAAVTAVVDNDQDGFSAAEDCDDNNASIHPDATEIPDNGVDEDCNGADEISIVDERACGMPTEITSSSTGRGRVAITWQSVTGADAYRIQIRLAGQDRWIFNSTIRRTSVSISGPSNSYEYHIQAICGGEESEFSPILPLVISRNFTGAESRSASGIADIVIAETSNNSEFRLYPNPVSTILSVQYEVAFGKANAQVHHLSGQLIYQTTLAEGNLTNQIDVAGFEDGIYLITIKEEGEIPVVKKFIKTSKY